MIKSYLIDLLTDEHVLGNEFDKMPRLDQAELMVEALINAGYRMIHFQTGENHNKWRRLVHRWRHIKREAPHE